MIDLDDFLNSIGIFEEDNNTPLEALSNNNRESAEVPAEENNSIQLVELSNSDIDEVLIENGFTNTFSEAEEISPLGLPDNTNNEFEMVEGEEENPEENIPMEEVDSETENYLIPPNSEELTVDDTTSRFSGAEWYNEIKNKQILLAGIGGIGSWCAFQLARTGIDSMALYDMDTVERANMSGQLFGTNDIGNNKADAISRFIRVYTSYTTVFSRPTEYRGEDADIMICGFDNMDARKLFFESWKRHLDIVEDKSKCLFIDGRLSMDTLQVFSISGDDDINIRRYQDNYLFSSEEADETICSMKQTTYMACMIGSIMTNTFVNWVANSLNPVIPYDLPFFVEYDAKYMLFKTQT